MQSCIKKYMHSNNLFESIRKIIPLIMNFNENLSRDFIRLLNKRNSPE